MQKKIIDYYVECFRGRLLLYCYTEGSEEGCGSFFLVHSFWVEVCSSGFVGFFPQKMSYLQSCVGCTCVLLSLIGKVFRHQRLLWPYCCCCAGRLLVLREGNEQRVFNRINQKYELQFDTSTSIILGSRLFKARGYILRFISEPLYRFLYGILFIVQQP